MLGKVLTMTQKHSAPTPDHCNPAATLGVPLIVEEIVGTWETRRGKYLTHIQDTPNGETAVNKSCNVEIPAEPVVCLHVPKNMAGKRRANTGRPHNQQSDCQGGWSHNAAPPKDD